jgi:hypothetical protein
MMPFEEVVNQMRSADWVAAVASKWNVELENKRTPNDSGKEDIIDRAPRGVDDNSKEKGKRKWGGILKWSRLRKGVEGVEWRPLKKLKLKGQREKRNEVVKRWSVWNLVCRR